MKGALLLFSLWFCIFAVTNGNFGCFIDVDAEAGPCVACGYHSVIASSSDSACEAKVERMCLNQTSFEYDDPKGTQQFHRIDKCTTIKKGCTHMLYICQTHQCNMNCGAAVLSESLPTETTSSFPSTTSQTETTEMTINEDTTIPTSEITTPEDLVTPTTTETTIVMD